MPVNRNYQKFNNTKDLELFIHKVTQQRINYPYQIDGIVIKLNQLKYYDQIGNTAKAPR